MTNEPTSTPISPERFRRPEGPPTRLELALAHELARRDAAVRLTADREARLRDLAAHWSTVDAWGARMTFPGDAAAAALLAVIDDSGAEVGMGTPVIATETQVLLRESGVLAVAERDDALNDLRAIAAEVIALDNTDYDHSRNCPSFDGDECACWRAAMDELVRAAAEVCR